MLFLQKKKRMEIGQKVFWFANNKKNEGLFIQFTDNKKSEIICYLMNGLNCKLRVFVDNDLIQLIKI